MRTSEFSPFRSAGLPAAAALALAILLAACASSPAHRLSLDNTFSNVGPEKTPWRTVAVLPFGGDPAMRRTAAEWFAHRLRAHGIVDVVDPAFAEIALRRKGAPPPGDEGYSPDGARRAGEALEAGGVVFGKMSTPDVSKRPFERPAVSATLLDVASGRVVADVLRPVDLLARDSYGNPLAAAVDNAVAGFLPAIYPGAGITAPPRPAPAPADDGGNTQ
jgi:hypothetical protein